MYDPEYLRIMNGRIAIFDGAVKKTDDCDIVYLKEGTYTRLATLNIIRIGRN